MPGGESGRSWWEDALLFGFFFSLFAHLCLAMAAIFIVQGVPRLGGESSEAPIEFASAGGSALTESALAPLAGDEVAVESAAKEQEFSIEDLVSPFVEAGGPGATELSVEGLAGSGSGGGSGDGLGEGMGLGGAGGEARFFGVEARGSRFAFVVDVSGSMLDAKKIGALQAALLESIEGMLESASFCVILYNDQPIPLMGEKWLRASEENKQSAERNIALIAPGGGTNPLPGFETAFGLKPRPDVIYFMTDGMFSPEIEEQLPGYVDSTNRNGDTRVTVHCITFEDRASEKLMRRIARQSGGSYTHVERPKQ